jgi:hypothetical protein
LWVLLGAVPGRKNSDRGDQKKSNIAKKGEREKAKGER